MTTSQHAAPWSMKRIIRMLSGAPTPRRRPPTGDVLTAREAVARHLFSEHVQASKLDMLDYDNSPRLQTVWAFEADRRIEHANSPDLHVAAFHRIPDSEWIHLPAIAKVDYRELYYRAKGL